MKTLSVTPKRKILLFTLFMAWNSFTSVFADTRVNTQQELTPTQNIQLTAGGGVNFNNDNEQDNINELRKQIVHLSSKIRSLGSEEEKARIKAQIQYYEYLNRKSEINLSQYEWQQSASNYILFLVIVVVLSGVLFSGFQIWKSSQTGDIKADSSIELSIQKIKVTSSVVGVIVLSISIVFLYFFLIEVYRINVVDMSKTEIENHFTQQAPVTKKMND